MNPKYFERRALALACLLLTSHTPARAQDKPALLESVIVTGSTESPDALTKPVSVLTNPDLLRQGAHTLGEALRQQPGMSATGFGPNASRPVVRGQDSDRIRILRNSAATLDASALSADHALPIDLFSVHQVEIIRGPAALAYGGNAVGGAVNLVDQRIAREAVSGLQGEVSLLGGGAASQTAGGFKLDAGVGQGISLHLDGFKRHTGDLNTPTFTNPDGVTGTRVQNSSSRSDGGAVAASVQTGQGYVGVSAERYDSEYGVPKKLDVRIGMENLRHALEGEQGFGDAAIQRVRYRLAKTDYQHQEFEGGAPETRFLSDGLDGRLELDIRPFNWGSTPVSAQAGWQFERTDFSAIGDEAFVPATETRQNGVFGILRIGSPQSANGVFEMGIRADQVEVNAASSGLSALTGPVAGAGVAAGPAIQRSFNPGSVSLGYTAPLGQGWSLGGSVSRIERAPSSFELYADGVHVATDAYEKGNPTLQEERGRHVEITSNWTGGQSRFKATVFNSRYSNYIALIGRTGANAVFDEDEDGDANPATGEVLQVFDFAAVPAEFQGIELSYSTVLDLRQGPVKGQLRPLLQYDGVRGQRTDGGGDLPRISPQRVIASAAYSHQGWTVAPEIIWSGKSRPGAGDTAVQSSQVVNLRLAKALPWSKLGGEVFANFNNLGDELAFSASTVSTVRAYTPLPGRSAEIGLRLAF